jgi:hypothetical protein
LLATTTAQKPGGSLRPPLSVSQAVGTEAADRQDEARRRANVSFGVFSI